MVKVNVSRLKKIAAAIALNVFIILLAFYALVPFFSGDLKTTFIILGACLVLNRISEVPFFMIMLGNTCKAEK